MKLLPVQGYMRQAMGSSAALRALVGVRIYDSIPPDPVFPYVAFGNADGHQYSFGPCWQAWELFQNVHAYSRAVGSPECKRIVDQICAALDERAPLIPAVRCSLFVFHNTRTMTAPDGVTTEAVVTFRTIYGPLT